MTRRSARRTPSRRSRALADGGVRRGGRRGGARRRVPVPAAAGAPAPDGARPADPRPPARPARAHHARAFARPPRRRRAAGRVRPDHGRWSAGSTSGSSTGRCWRRSPGRRSPRPGIDRAATEELLAGLGLRRSRLARYDVLARARGPADTRWARSLANVFPVMAPALALAADPGRGARSAGTGRRGGGGPPGARPTRSPPTPARPGGSRTSSALARFATDLLVAEPERILALADSLVGVPADDAHGAARRASSPATPARELTPRETGEAIAAVADRVVRGGGRRRRARPCPFAVIGLGKLGAQRAELRERPRRRVRLRGRGARRPRQRRRRPPSG